MNQPSLHQVLIVLSKVLLSEPWKWYFCKIKPQQYNFSCRSIIVLTDGRLEFTIVAMFVCFLFFPWKCCFLVNYILEQSNMFRNTMACASFPSPYTSDCSWEILCLNSSPLILSLNTGNLDLQGGGNYFYGRVGSVVAFLNMEKHSGWSGTVLGSWITWQFWKCSLLQILASLLYSYIWTVEFNNQSLLGMVGNLKHLFKMPYNHLQVSTILVYDIGSQVNNLWRT